MSASANRRCPTTFARLAAERFVHLRADGTRTLVTVNRDCLQEFPEAAARIMGFETP